MSASDDKTILDHTRRVSKHQIENSPIYAFILRDVVIKEASEGFVRAQLTIDSKHVNSRGTIHGAAVTAAIVDWSGSLAIISHGRDKTSASVDIHISYIGTAVVDDVIEIIGTTSKVGQSLGFTTVEITKLLDGKPAAVIAKASHTKYIRNTPLELQHGENRGA